jgi:iron complex outermembrane receptor protein
MFSPNILTAIDSRVSEHSGHQNSCRFGLVSKILLTSFIAGVPASALFAQAAPATDANLEEIVVTGTLIKRADYKAESPTSTLSSAAIAASGQPSLDRVMGQMPQFAAAQGAAQVGDVQGTVLFGGGASYSDLRGIGRNRSLVLLDGRRLMPSTPDGAIDLNTIPTSMLESVEVITGGASATYGSDAVAGVANFKLRQNFSGLELNAQEGTSTHGDGTTTQFGAIAGGKIADGRGHVVAAFEYSRRQTVDGSARPFFTQPSVRFLGRPAEGDIFSGGWGAGATAPTVAAVNSVLATYPGTTPLPGSGPYVGAIGVNTDQTLYTSAGSACAQNYKGVGSVRGAILSNCTTAGVVLGNYFAVQVPLTKYNVFTKADFAVADHVTAYGQFNFSESIALDQNSPGSSKTNAASPQELKIPVSNQFVQSNPALLSLVNSAYGGVPPAGSFFYYSKSMFGWPPRTQNFKYDVWQALGGLMGDIPGTKLNWDLYTSYGRSNYSSQALGDFSIGAFTNLLANEGVGGCTYNPFGIQPVSAACLKYAGRTDNTSNVLTSKNIQLTVDGPLIMLPGGESKFALGADYRSSGFNYQPDSTFITGDSLSYGSDTASQGSQNVKEVFGELLVPILQDQFMAKDLSLDLGYRRSQYDTFSAKSTWKADLSWEVQRGFRLRGGYSVAIRAPSLSDLYVGSSVSDILISGDPCDTLNSYRTGPNAAQIQAVCAAQSPGAGAGTFSYRGGVATIPVKSGGNSLLQPENAKTWSVGTVFTPLTGLDISVDYYNINIAGAISSLSANQILADCYGTAANPTLSPGNSFCQRIQRDPRSGNIALLTSGTFNFNEIKLDGIDTQIDYQFGLDELGLVKFGSIISYLHHYTVAPGDGTPPVEYAGGVTDTLVTADGENLYSHPHWKANTTVGYSIGAFTGTLRWRYIGRMANLDVPNAPVLAYHYFDMDAHYNATQHLTLTFGINNIANKIPPYIASLELRTDAATYDVIGRTFYAAVKYKL